MKRSLRRIAATLALASLFVLPSAGLADDVATSPAQAATALSPASGRPALWKVSDEDTAIYLFGTVHALPSDTNWLTTTVTEALASAGQLVTEVDIGQAASVRPQLEKLAMLPEGKTLRVMMSAADRSAYEKALAGLGLPPDAFDRFEPWYAAMIVSLLPLANQGFNADSGVETVLLLHAPGKDHTALETIEYQLGLFDALPVETQLAYLRQVSDAVPDMEKTLRDMLAKWLEGDADALARLMNDGTTDPVLMDRLLLQRNRNWAGWIVERLKTPGTVFMAVGAGHLAGDGSVQDQLVAQGISAQRVQ